jgi:DNA-binding response OmpR family regulator
MNKLLVVDDDESMRNLLRTRLAGAYEVIDTGDPEQALALALEHKPDAVLLDLMMPRFSGFELCQSLRSMSYTSHIPVFIITGKGGGEAKEHCKNLGATGYFEKPVDFQYLKQRVSQELQAQRPERRAQVRVRMRIPLKLRGTDAVGNIFEETTATDNVSAGGFLCSCTTPLAKGALVEVFLSSGSDRFAGRARVVRKESPMAAWQRYGFHFEEKTGEWVLQE